MGFLASLIPAGISLAGSLLGGDRKKTQVQTQPSQGAVPEFVLNTGNKLAGFVSDFLPQFTPGLPYAGQLSEGMSPTETQGQSFLQQFLQAPLGDIFQSGKRNIIDTLSGGYDPTTSDFFRGLRANALTERDEAIDAVNRAAAAGGNFFTDSRIRSAGDVATKTSNFLTQTLGELFNQERNRQVDVLGLAPTYEKMESELPLRKATAASDLGSVPRLIKQAALERNYLEFQRQRTEAQLPLTVGQGVVSSGSGLRSPNTGFVERYAPSTFERVTGAVNGLLGQNPAFFDDLLTRVGGLFR